MTQDPQNNQRIKVIIAEDHQIVIDGLKSLMASDDNTEVVATAQNGTDIVDLTRKLKPDVVLMDIGMPGMNGIEVTRIIKRDFPDVKVIALSMHSERKFILEMLKAGAKGYLLKDCAFNELFDAIKTVCNGRNYLSPSITDTVIQDAVSEEKNLPTAFNSLTDRERQVLQLLAEGRTTRQAAADLHISPKTVETHRSNIMAKLEIDNLAELTKYALREGLTTIE
jgi:DNA-binding NarL/FixJ family response regulator